jgi:RNA polymerase sigma-70 factor, ECF subfamily
MVPSEEDFDRFFTACFRRLVGQLFVVTGDLHEAEDLAQEALTRAAARWERVSRLAAPEAWVRRVALNLATDRTRRARRRVTALARLGPPPAVAALDAEDLALADALRALPPHQRQVLMLHHVLGFGVQEVAKELGIPRGTVLSRLSRGRQALASLLAVDTVPGPITVDHESPAGA